MPSSHHAASTVNGVHEMILHICSTRSGRHLLLADSQRTLQAGQIDGLVLHSMGSALRNGGLGALYSGHLAFIMHGLPYDVAELVTYSQLRAVKGPLRHMPTEVRDMLIGEQHAT